MPEAIAFILRIDEITPSLERLMSDELRQKLLLAAGTVVESFAVRAFDEPGLRPTSWPARRQKAPGAPAKNISAQSNRTNTRATA